MVRNISYEEDLMEINVKRDLKDWNKQYSQNMGRLSIRKPRIGKKKSLNIDRIGVTKTQEN